MTPKTLTPVLRPTYKQHLCYQKLFDDVTRFIGFGGGAGGGKSWLGCEWLLSNCYRYPGSKWFMARKQLTTLMGSTYITFQKVCRHHKIPRSDWRLNGQYHYIEFINPDTRVFDGMGSRIDLLDVAYLPTDPEFTRFGSLEYTGGWIEEAGEIHFLAFDVLKSRCGRHMNKEFGLLPKLLCTMNPTKNWIYRIFYKPWKDGVMEKEYAFIQSLYKDNPHTADSYGEQLDLLKDVITKLRLRDGIWEYADEDTVLIEYDAIIDLFSNSLVEARDKWITVDAARFGSDRIVICLWRGLEIIKVVIKTKQGTDVTKTDIRDLAIAEGVPYSHVVCDEDGVGGGIVDNMKGIKGFINNSSPLETKDPLDATKTKKENYSNLKTQCSYMLADKINNHLVAITADLSEEDKDLLIEELQQIKKKITPDVSKLQIVPKEDVKEALGRSPDLSDAVMMRMYFELDKPKVSTYKREYGFGGVATGI